VQVLAGECELKLSTRAIPIILKTGFCGFGAVFAASAAFAVADEAAGPSGDALAGASLLSAMLQRGGLRRKKKIMQDVVGASL